MMAIDMFLYRKTNNK